MKNFGVLAVVFLAMTVILSLLTALANGVANAATSIALLTSQYLGGFMMVIVLVAGAGVGVTAYRLVSRRQTRQLPYLLNIIPVPFSVLQSHRSQTQGDLSVGTQSQPEMYIPELAQADDADNLDVLFHNWGW